jgi:hypothetical protein
MAVCFTLVALLLYNPFAAFLHLADGLSVNHLPRNRATIGAGEMQHFSPVAKATTPLISVSEYFREILATSEDQDFPPGTRIAPTLAILQLLSSNLFFRPPPSA